MRWNYFRPALACLYFFAAIGTLCCGFRPEYSQVNTAAFTHVDATVRSEFITSNRLALPARLGVARVQATPYYCEAVKKQLLNGGLVLAPTGRAEYGLDAGDLRTMHDLGGVELLYPVTPLPVPSLDDVYARAKDVHCDYLLVYSMTSQGGGNNFGFLGLITLNTIDPDVTRGDATCYARLIDLRNGQIVMSFGAMESADWAYLSGSSWDTSRDRAAMEAELRALQATLNQVREWWNAPASTPVQTR